MSLASTTKPTSAKPTDERGKLLRELALAKQRDEEQEHTLKAAAEAAKAKLEQHEYFQLAAAEKSAREGLAKFLNYQQGRIAQEIRVKLEALIPPDLHDSITACRRELADTQRRFDQSMAGVSQPQGSGAAFTRRLSILRNGLRDLERLVSSENYVPGMNGILSRLHLLFQTEVVV